MENNYDNFKEENFLFGKDKRNSFIAPKGYFDSLSGRVMNKIECEQELVRLKILAQNKQKKFTVPKNYFLELTNILECKYELSVFSELNKITKPVLKSLPSDYFETFDKKVMDKLELESELKEFSILSSIPKKNTFKTAPNYFESKTDLYEEQIYDEKNKKGVVRQLLAVVLKPQIAIAASLALTIGLTALWYFNRADSKVLNSDCMTLACLEKNEILNEKNIQDFDDENLYEMVDEVVLNQQLSKDETSEDSLNTNKE